MSASASRAAAAHSDVRQDGSAPWSPDALRAAAAALRGRAGAFRRMPAGRVLAVLDALHGEWAAGSSAPRAEAARLLHASTGYPEEVLDRGLRGLFAAMRRRAMERWLAAGGVRPERLDAGPGGAPGGFAAWGPELTVVVASGNIPGAALPSVVTALLLKSPCLVKSPSAEPALLPLYARTLARRDGEVGEMLAVTAWEGGRADLEAALLAEAEALVAYGADPAIQALRSLLPPRARFLGYGHRISFAAVGRERLTPARAPAAARAAARDLCLFDQQGCLSPQAVYVEEGGRVSPERFAVLVAGALEGMREAIPRRPLSPAESAAIHQYRAAAEMRALREPGLRLHASPGGTAWSLVLDPDPLLRPAPLDRTAVLRPLADLAGLPEAIAGCRAALCSAALGVGPERLALLARALGEAGVTRVCPLGRAQEPAALLFHDGLNAAAALARFVTLER